MRINYGRFGKAQFSITPNMKRCIHLKNIFYTQDRCTGSGTSHGSKCSVYIDGRPRYDPGTYDSYCARSRNERSLHDLPLLDPARSPIRRYSDLLIANNAPHMGYRLYLRPHIDMTMFPSMRKSIPRVENERYGNTWRTQRREKCVVG